MTVVASGGGQRRTATVYMDDIYELTSQAALEVTGSLFDGAAPGIQASGAVVGEPAQVAKRIGVRLSVSGHSPCGRSSRSPD